MELFCYWYWCFVLLLTLHIYIRHVISYFGFSNHCVYIWKTKIFLLDIRIFLHFICLVYLAIEFNNTLDNAMKTVHGFFHLHVITGWEGYWCVFRGKNKQTCSSSGTHIYGWNAIAIVRWWHCSITKKPTNLFSNYIASCALEHAFMIRTQTHHK